MNLRILRKLLLATTVAAGALMPAAMALAQDYPNRALKFIVPFASGSGTDTSARYLGRKLTDLTGQPVALENKPVANVFIVVKQVLSAAVDGYTELVSSNSTLAVNVALFKQLLAIHLTWGDSGHHVKRYAALTRAGR